MRENALRRAVNLESAMSTSGDTRMGDDDSPPPEGRRTIRMERPCELSF